MKDEFKQPKIDTTRYAVEVKGDIVPVMGLDYDSLTYANGMFELRGYAKKKFKELDEWK